MKAIRIHEHGDAKVLKIDDIKEPQPGPQEVRVKIKASALNHMDLWVRNGMPGIGKMPLTLGCDGAGIIESVGSEVKDLQKGDRVVVYPVLSCGVCSFCLSGLQNHCKEMQLFGEHVNGMHAEIVSVSQNNVIKLDKRISFEEAAAFPLVFLTAWHMLVYNGQVKPKNTVLILGAGSGVGSAAIQIAKHHGATVIATAGSEKKLEKARELGADFLIHHYQDSISEQVKEITNRKGVDIVVEHVGLKVWSECLKSLSWSGRLITCGATTGPKVQMDLRHLFIKQQSIIGSTMGSLPEMKAIHELVAKGSFKPVIAKAFPCTDVQQAHEFLEKSEQFGKVIITW